MFYTRAVFGQICIYIYVSNVCMCIIHISKLFDAHWWVHSLNKNSAMWVTWHERGWHLKQNFLSLNFLDKFSATCSASWRECWWNLCISPMLLILEPFLKTQQRRFSVVGDFFQTQCDLKLPRIKIGSGNPYNIWALFLQWKWKMTNLAD